MATLGLILSGGRSRRMGADKAFVSLDGRPLLAHALAALAPQCARLALSANGDPAVYASFGAPVLPDGVANHAGPLAGVLAGLTFAAGRGCATMATASVDSPFLPADFVARLAAARPEGGIAVAASGGRTHWTNALWPVAGAEPVAAALAVALAQGRNRMEDFVQAFPCAVVTWAGDPFFNVNTPDDLAAAERALTR